MEQRNPLVLFVLLLSVSLIGNSCRRERKTDAELNALIEKNIQARGGREKLSAIESLRITAQYIQGGRKTPLRLTIKRPGLISAEMMYPANPLICGFDGRTAWWFDRTRLAKPEIVPAEIALIFTRFADFGGWFIDPEEKGQAIEWLGMEDVNGQGAHKLKVKSRAGIIRHVYLDAGSFLVVKEAYRSRNNKKFGMDVMYKDYRAIDGIMFPFLHDIGGEQTVIEKIETNVAVDDSIFKMPQKAGQTEPMGVPGFVRELDDFLRKNTVSDLFSGVVLVARDGKPIFRKAYGMADQERKIPNQPGTRFCIGSMNKMFTAVAIAQLVEQGKLGYDERIAKYLGAEWILPEVGEKVIISHLLSHTSGIAEFLTDELYNSSWGRYRRMKDYQPLVREMPLTFAPGARWEYSNTGFILLGAIIEKASGRGYWDYVKRHVFDPAGMDDTIGFDRNGNLPDLAMGYEKVREGGKPSWRKLAFAGQANGSSAGGGFSTVDDLLKFAGALRSDRLIRRESRELLMAVKARSESAGIEYGYGFLIDSHGRLGRIVGHGGAAPGVSANFRMLIDQNYDMIVLANFSEASLPVSRHIRNLLPLK